MRKAWSLAAALAMLFLVGATTGCSQISQEQRFVSCKAGAACPKCHGLGSYRCEACLGRGNVQCTSCNGRGQIVTGKNTSSCFMCDGTGMAKCSACDGKGMIPCGTTLTSYRCRGCGAQYDYRPTRCPKCGAE